MYVVLLIFFMAKNKRTLERQRESTTAMTTSLPFSLSKSIKSRMNNFINTNNLFGNVYIN